MDVLSLIVSIASAVAAFLGWIAAKRSADHAKEALEASREQFKQSAEMSKSMFKRQGVIDLHMAWRDVKTISPNAPVVPDIVHAVAALDLTASLWNHEVIEHEILLQSYWANYQQLHDSLDRWDDLIPELKAKGKDLLTLPIRTAYEQMKAEFLKKTKQTQLP